MTIGALMNTRGLMELIVLNIGYDLGVLSPEIFAMMVIMALFTTFMTGPSLDFINYIFKGKKSENEEDVDDSGRKYK
ncbi:cation:proton antiporter, partial [Klebsiella pneumoniae]|uniref:cation:proton antiporter domain-containing protein n=1 Tax=Klebsiella pneumoniae TaxID=573 RepID=UPI00272FEC54